MTALFPQLPLTASKMNFTDCGLEMNFRWVCSSRFFTTLDPQRWSLLCTVKPRTGELLVSYLCTDGRTKRSGFGTRPMLVVASRSGGDAMACRASTVHIMCSDAERRSSLHDRYDGGVDSASIRLPTHISSNFEVPWSSAERRSVHVNLLESRVDYSAT